MMKLIYFSLFFLVVSGNAHSNPLKRNFVKGEILVKYKATLNSLEQKNAIESKGGKRIARINQKGLSRISVKNNLEIDKVISEYKKDPNVEYAQPNYIYHATALPNDPRFGQLWGLKNTGQTIVSAGGRDAPSSSSNPGTIGKDMNLEYAWNTITDCSSVIVGVLDTGINYLHEDLSDNMWDGGVPYPNHGYNFVENTDDPMDNQGHGTHVAGTIGAVGNNNLGSTGVCWNVKLMAIRVLGTTGSGTTASIIAGINFAVDNGAKVLNMSLGGGSFDAAYSTAIAYAQTNGVLIIAAAGNDAAYNEATPMYPCNFTNANIVCTAALAQNYTLATFSNYGAISVDVAAPGVNVVSAWPGTHSVMNDALTSGWSFSSNTASTWGYKSLNFGSPVSCLVNPPNYNYSNAYYSNNTDARAYKSFNLSSSNAATLSFYMMIDTAADDYVDLYLKTGTGDPVSAPNYVESFGGSTGGSRYEAEYDLNAYLGGNFTVGFNLVTDASGVNYGSNISEFNIQTLSFNPTTYNVISGTSMAAPHVTGLAAILFAFNPDYTYQDVALSIKNGGVLNGSLSGKTVTGKAVSAIGSLNYIALPTGVSATILP